MRIVQFVTRMDVLGGAQTHVLDLAKGLVVSGHEVIVISHGTSVLTEELSNYSVDYIDIPTLTVPIRPGKDIRTWRRLKRILQRVKPDLLAIHSSKAGIIGRLVGKQLQIPTVFTAHSWSFSCIDSFLKRKIYIGMERFVGLFSTGIITVSHYNLQEALQYNIANHVSKTVIHNGIEDRLAHIQPFQSNEIIHIVMVARFATPKNHQLLIDALRKLTAYNWKLTLVGDGPLLPAITSYVRTCGLQDRVDFTGESTDVEAILEGAHLFILASTSEGLPISIIEAMRAGLPTIASNVGGINELIDDGTTGFLVDQGQVKELTNAIEKLLQNSSLRTQFGMNARRKFINEFMIDDMLAKTERYYETVVMKQQPKKQEVLEG